MSISIIYQIINVFLKATIIYPAASVFLLAMIHSGFSFKPFFFDTFEYISKVSQVPAESPNHVNQISCKDPQTQIPTQTNNSDVKPSLFKPLCSDIGLVSTTIDHAANEAARTTKNIYVMLVFLFFTLELGIRLMFYRINDTHVTPADGTRSKTFTKLF
jgi:hypothetical protein